MTTLFVNTEKLFARLSKIESVATCKAFHYPEKDIIHKKHFFFICKKIPEEFFLTSKSLVRFHWFCHRFDLNSSFSLENFSEKKHVFIRFEKFSKKSFSAENFFQKKIRQKNFFLTLWKFSRFGKKMSTFVNVCQRFDTSRKLFFFV